MLLFVEVAQKHKYLSIRKYEKKLFFTLFLFLRRTHY